MKKDRNCGMQYSGSIPMMPMMPIPNQIPMPNYQASDYQIPNQNNDLLSQLNNLEKRVSILENILNNNSYNNSNYQMM